MHGLKTKAHVGLTIALLLAASILLAGCAATINYVFDPTASFAGLKTYNWAEAGNQGASSDLVVKNVQYLADQVLDKKGLRKTVENPDVLISVSYENEIGIDQYGYQLRMLTLGIQKTDGKQLIWRGTATGTVNADAASGDLKSTVEKILKGFPPMKG